MMFFQILANSVSSGLLLSLMAVGFYFVFHVTKVFHLAQSTLYVWAVYLVWWLNLLFSNIFDPILTSFVVLPLSLIIIGIIALGIEKWVYLPLYDKKASQAITLISSLGVMLLLNNLIVFFFRSETITLNNHNAILIQEPWLILTEIQLIQVIITLLILGSLYFFTRTTYYKQLDALIDDALVAQKFGIDVKKYRTLAILLSAFLAGVSGILHGYEVGMDADAGLAVTLTASVAVIMGGLRSIWGTVLASFVIALIENFSVTIFPAQWKEAFTYLLLITVLMFWKEGLFSTIQRIEER